MCSPTLCITARASSRASAPTRPTVGPAVFRLTDHLERLMRSAKLYYMELPYTMAELAAATKEVIAANGLDALLHPADRLSRLRRDGPVPAQGAGRLCHRRLALGQPTWETRASRTASALRSRAMQSLDANSIPPAAKACGQYLNSMLAKVEVTQGRLRRGSHAEPSRLRHAGLGREHLLRARRRHQHAAARRRPAGRHHARHRACTSPPASVMRSSSVI